MTPLVALARTELTLLRRNTTAWATAVAIPFLIGAVWALNDPPVGDGLGAIIALQVVLLLVFTLHTAGAMMLASRRQQLVLKRWRSSQASAAAVLAGSVAVPAGLVVLQAGVLTALTSTVWDERPASLMVLLVGVLGGVAVVAALTFLVAAFTRSAEHAMITTFPTIAVLFGGSVWALMRPFDPFDWPVLAIPGGAATQLLRLAWDGPAGAPSAAQWLLQSAPSVGATIILTAVVALAATRWFRWEPRS